MKYDEKLFEEMEYDLSIRRFFSVNSMGISLDVSDGGCNGSPMTILAGRRKQMSRIMVVKTMTMILQGDVIMFHEGLSAGVS